MENEDDNSDSEKLVREIIDNQKILVKNQAKILEFIEKSATHVASINLIRGQL
ncbi:hypothetical protein KPL47_07815 [Clostridium estertheticum]|uniref:hypothetical protein n=1 Tax=Clostridium estertheticum TaxID=238834 RepID=UPI001C0B34C0|nr:hypothetical protein [Clostridium estertheticum]MBU3176276.1 hypothetical protein [Clostridium estertheticum]